LFSIFLELLSRVYFFYFNVVAHPVLRIAVKKMLLYNDHFRNSIDIGL